MLPQYYPNPDGAAAGSPYASAAPLTGTSPNNFAMASSAPSPYAAPSTSLQPKTAFPWGAAIGAAASLFGGGGSDFGMGDYMQGEKSANANQSSLADQYRGLGGQQIDYLGQDQTSQRKATADYANYLKQNPFTDQQRTSDIAKMTGGIAGGYQQARAQLALGNNSANGGSAGVGSAPSSQTMGGNNYLAAQQAGTLAGAQASEFNNVQADRERRLQALQGLYTGQTGQDYSMGSGFLGSAGSGYQNVFNNNSTMYGQAAQQAQAQASSSPWAAVGAIAPYIK